MRNVCGDSQRLPQPVPARDNMPVYIFVDEYKYSTSMDN